MLQSSFLNRAVLNGELIEAVVMDDIKSVENLLARGADVNGRDKQGNTALIFAALYGHIALVKVLIRRQAKLHLVNQDGYNALIVAARGGKSDVVEMLLRINLYYKNKVDVNAVDNKEANSALMLASHNGYLPVVQALLTDLKIIVDAPNIEGNTALIFSVKNNHMAILKALTARLTLAAIHKTNKEGVNAFQLAIKLEHYKIAKFLIAKCSEMRPTIDSPSRPLLLHAFYKKKPTALLTMIENEEENNLENDQLKAAV